jgi:hypothetical protein
MRRALNAPVGVRLAVLDADCTRALVLEPSALQALQGDGARRGGAP